MTKQEKGGEWGQKEEQNVLECDRSTTDGWQTAWGILGLKKSLPHYEQW